MSALATQHQVDQCFTRGIVCFFRYFCLKIKNFVQAALINELEFFNCEFKSGTAPCVAQAVLASTTLCSQTTNKA